MKKIVTSHNAERNLRDIALYIAQFNPIRAETFVQEIRHFFHTIAAIPFIGRARTEFNVSNLRSVHFKNHILFYQPFEDHIYILNIYHGARDIDALFHDGDEEHG